MKNIILVMMLLFCIGNSYGQKKYPGQWSIGSNGGVSSVNAFTASIVGENVIHGNSSLLLEIHYANEKYIAGSKYAFEVKQFSFKPKYQYAVNLTNILLLNLQAGLSFGYELAPKKLDHDIILENSSGWNLGINLSPQLEVSISPKWSIVISPSLSYRLITNFEDTVLGISCGFKYYL